MCCSYIVSLNIRGKPQTATTIAIHVSTDLKIPFFPLYLSDSIYFCNRAYRYCFPPAVMPSKSEDTKERKHQNFLSEKISNILSPLHRYGTNEKEMQAFLSFLHTALSREAYQYHQSSCITLPRFSKTTYLPFITINSSLFPFAEITTTLAKTILNEKI